MPFTREHFISAHLEIRPVVDQSLKNLGCRATRQKPWAWPENQARLDRENGPPTSNTWESMAGAMKHKNHLIKKLVLYLRSDKILFFQDS